MTSIYKTTGRDSDAPLRRELRGKIELLVSVCQQLETEYQEEGQSSVASDISIVRKGIAAMLDLVNAGLAPGMRAAAAVRNMHDKQASGVGTLLRMEEAVHSGQGEEVMVVDERGVLGAELAETLSRSGFQPTLLSKRREALKQIESHRFDLVLLDLGLSRASRFKLPAAIRRRFAAAELPVLLVLDAAATGDAQTAARLGINDVISAPVDLPILPLRVRAHITMRKTMERVRGLVKQLRLRNRMITQVFGRYLSDELVEKLLASPDGPRLGGEKRVVTIMFADLRGFSAISERIPPEDVVATVNNFMQVMSETTQRYKAMQVDFRGDCIVAAFGALEADPDHARNAVACALEMQQGMADVCSLNLEAGLPAVELGIGLHTGEVVVGNVGSDKYVKHTVMGRHANLAARVESCTVGGQVLISEATHQAAGSGVEVKQSLKVAVKGSTEPIVLLDVIGLQGGPSLAQGAIGQILQRLSRPVPLDLQQIGADKQRLPGSFAGHAVALSVQEAEVETSADVAVLSDVCCHFAHAPDEDYYGKVIEADGKSRVVIRFTSISPSLSKLVDDLLE